MSSQTPRFVTALVALLALVAAPLCAGTIWIVDVNGGPGSDLLQIQDAVDIAVGGDTILVRSGTYLPFTIDAKPLVVSADVGAEVLFFSSNPISFVKNIPAGQRVVLSGLGPAPAILPAAVVRLEQNDGAVWLQDCHLRGMAQGLFGEPDIAGLSISECANVMVSDCTIAGVFAGSDDAGVEIESSKVAIHDSVIVGGKGSNGAAGLVDGSPGGAGLLVHSGQVYLSGSSVTGGTGGDGGPFEVVILCGNGGPGGTALVLGDGQPQVTLRDTTLTAGPGGGADALCDPGPEGLVTEISSGSLDTLPGDARSFSMTSPVRELETITVTFTGAPGELAFGLLSSGPSLQFTFGSLGGAFLLASPFQAILLGVLDGNGELSFTTSTVDPFGPGVLPLTLHAQAAFQGGGEVALSGGRALVLLDDSTP